MFRLYAGLEIDGTWYNHAKCEEIKGGVIALLDGHDKTTAGRLRNLVEGSVKSLFTDEIEGEDSKELVLKKEDYGLIKVEDAWKISMEARKQFLGTDKPIVDESFFCTQCSRRGSEKYTSVKESWDQLIDPPVQVANCGYSMPDCPKGIVRHDPECGQLSTCDG